MRKFLVRYEDPAYVLLTAVEVISAALIVGFAHHFIPGGLVFVVILACAIGCHFAIYRATRHIGKRDQTAIIEHVLEVASRALVFPMSWEDVRIRAYCHELDKKENLLKYIAAKASYTYDDSFMDIPLDAYDKSGKHIYVIAEAACDCHTVFRELPDKRTDQERERHIWDEVHFVLAAPIFERGRTKCFDTCMGVISMDTTRSGGQHVNFGDERAHDIVIQVAQTISYLWS